MQEREARTPSLLTINDITLQEHDLSLECGTSLPARRDARWGVPPRANDRPGGAPDDDAANNDGRPATLRAGAEPVAAGFALVSLVATETLGALRSFGSERSRVALQTLHRVGERGGRSRVPSDRPEWLV